jgi:hypothetical protein
MWYEITFPGFSYSFETDRYRSEAEARNDIFSNLARGDIEYMRKLKIRAMWEKYGVDTPLKEE